MIIDKDTVIKELNDFADSLTVISGSYIRSAIRVVIEPMKEAPEAAELAELKHKIAVQDTAVKKLFDAMAKKQPQIIRCDECKYSYETIDGLFCSYGVCADCVVYDAFYCGNAERRQNG